MKKYAFDIWVVFLLMRGSNQSKYGTLLKWFVSQFSLGNCQYLKTTTTSTNVLPKHLINPKLYENNRDKCSCDKANNDTEDEKISANRFAHKYETWYCCGEKGHIEPYCPRKQSNPKYQWNVRRFMQNMQGAGDDTITDTRNTDDTPTIEFYSYGIEGWKVNQNNWNSCQKNAFCSFQAVEM